MNRLYFRTIWISDLHLGTRHVNAQQLLDFLNRTHCECLYLVGDIIDFWKLERAKHWPPINNHIIRAVLKKARSGTSVVYIPGNHDEVMRDYAGRQLHQVSIVREAIHTTACGRKFLVTHGDEFDCVLRHNRWLGILGSALYELLLEANTQLNRWRSLLGLPYWSVSAWLKLKTKKAVNAISRYEEVVAVTARQRKVDGYICGHIHHAASKDIGGIIYKNIGDWVESCTALVEDTDGTLNILSWADRQEIQPAPAGEIYEDCYSNRRLAPTG